MADEYGLSTGMDYLNSVPAPYVPPAPVAPVRPQPVVNPQASMPQGKGLIPSLVEEQETLLGRKLQDTDLDGIREYARDGHLMPTLAQQGLSEWEAKAQATAFDKDFDKFKAQYLANGAPPSIAAGAPDNGAGKFISQPIAAVGVGLTGMAGGIASMADYGLRYAKGLAMGAKDLITGDKTWGQIDAPEELIEAYAPKKTGLGELATGIDSVANDIRNKYYSKHTLDANQEVAKAVGENNYKELGRLLITKPDVAATFALEMIGGIGGAGQLTKIPKYAKLVSTLAAAGKAERYAARAAQVLPSAIGYAGQQAQQFETGIRDTSIDTLIQNPEIAGIYEAAKIAGYTPAEAAEKTKDHVIATGLDDVLTTSLLANAALPAIGGLGVAERFFATGGTKIAGKAVAGGTIRNVLSAGAREATEESIASAVEQAGLNTGNRQDITTNLGTQAVLGGTIGALVGAPIGGLEARVENKNKLKKQAQVEDTSTPTATPGAPAAPAVSTQANNLNVSSPTPLENFDKVSTAVLSAYQENPTLKKQASDAAKQVATVADLVDVARNVAATVAKRAGTQWATMDVDQQVALTESIADLLNKSRKTNKFDNLAEEIVSRKQAPVAAPVAPVAAPVAAAPVAESTPEEVRAAIEEVAATPSPAAAPAEPAVTTPEQEKENLDRQLITDYGIDPALLAKLNLEQTKNFHASTIAQAEAAKAAVTPAAAATPKAKPLTASARKAQEQALYLDKYMKAILNEGPSRGPDEEAIRADPSFNTARAALKAGKITTPAELNSFLATASEEVKTPEPTSENVLIGAALGLKGAKKSVTDVKKLARILVDEVVKRGETEATAKAMTIAQAKEYIKRVGEPAATPAVKTKPLKSKAKKEEAPNPKTQAPAQEVAGAAESNEKPSPQPENQPDINEPDDIETRLSGILADTPVLQDIQEEIVLAIANKDVGELSNIVRGIRDAGDISSAQAKQIQALINIKPKTGIKVNLEPIENIGALESLEARMSITNILDRVAQNPDANVVEVIPKLRSLLKDYTEGTLTENQLMAEIDTIAPVQTKAAKGIDWFEQRLAEALRNKELPPKTVELMRFLIRQNPNLVTDATLSVRKLNVGKAKDMPLTRGLYEVAEQMISLATDAGRNESPHVGVHELLHHAERMMPPKVREGIRKAYTRDLANQIKSSQSEDVKAYLEQALAMAQTGDYSEANNKQLSKLFQKATETGEGFAMPLLYQFHSPSEYWAVNGPVIVQARAEAAGSWIVQAKQWFKEFVEKLKNLVGMSNKSAIIRGLDSILASDGKFLASRLIAGEATNVSSLEPTTKANLKTKLAETQAGARRFWEATAQRLISFEQEENRIANNGGKITPDNSITLATVRYNGLMNDRLSIDESEVASGVYNWFSTNWQAFGETKQKAIHNINKFLHNTHVLERNHVLWLMHGKLGGGEAFNREVLLGELRDNVITPEDARAQLERMVASHATETEATYGAKVIADYDTLIEQLVQLKAKGIHKTSMGELNTRMQAMRDRTLMRNQQSGFVDVADPWIPFYNFKWYVPLKGTASAESNSQISDLDQEGALGRQSLARLNKQIESMTGRKSIAQTPLEQLIVDMAIAGRRTAEQDFVASAMQLILDNREMFKDTTIDVFEGRTKDGFKQTSGKKKKSKKTKKEITFYRRLPAPGDGFIVHDGDTHYVVKLPPSSLMLRGILQMGNEANLNWLDKASGKVTNVLSKLYTTANPLWQTFVALPRDLTYMPIMMAMREERNPIKATGLIAKYVGNLLSNAFDTSNFPATVAILTDSKLKLEQYAKANPTSSVAWLRRYESSGGSTNFVAGFNTATLGNKLTGKYENAEGIWVVTKPWRTFEKFTNNYASLLENIARVAAFRTLVESGMTDREAAAKVKDYLNYDQKGNYSRKINSYIPFFKVGMTGADAMRKTFMDKKGNFDKAKFAAWATYFLVLGASKYLLDDELLGKDENGESNLKKIKLDTLTQKAVIKVGDQTFGFNIGLGLPQVLLAPGTIMGAVMAGHATPDEAMRAYYEMIGRNAPVRPAGLPKDWGWEDFVISWTTGSAIPAAVNPIQGIRDNRDAFGRDIHTRYGDDKKFKSDQAKSSTADTWSDLANSLRENVGVDMYPEDIRYLVKNYGGQLASKFIQATVEGDVEQNAGAGAQDTVGRATGMLVTDSDFYLRNETYDTLNELSAAVKRQTAVKKAAAREGTDEDAAVREWMAATPGAAAQIAAHKALDKAIDDYGKQIKVIRADKLRGQTWKETQRKLADSKLREAYLKAQKSLPE